MKKFNQFVNEAKVDVQEDTINYISVKDLEKYLKVADHFLSTEGKAVVNWLIEHPNYVKELGGSSKDNALAAFISRHSPSNDSEKELLKNAMSVIKKGRILEIPVFQTEDQFNGIISGKISPDEIILDLETEAGRNAVVKKYQGLVNKIVNQYVGKTVMSRDDIYSAALLGLTYAMNDYGKAKKVKKNEPEDADETIDNDEENEVEKLDKTKQTTFGQYAAQRIRFTIIHDIRNISRTVRVPVSAQNKEKDETGSITASNTVSGDRRVGGEDDENSRTLFDTMAVYADDADSNANSEDMQKVLQKAYDKIEKEFPGKISDIFFSLYGVNGYEQMQNKELAKKYDVSPSNINYAVFKVTKFIQTDPSMKKIFKDIYTLYKECMHDKDMMTPHEPYVNNTKNNINEEINVDVVEDDDDPDNIQYKIKTWFKQTNESSQSIIDIMMKSMFEMDEQHCRQYINNMLLNEDELSKKYCATIKSFVNFVFDKLDESESTEYADCFIKIVRQVNNYNRIHNVKMNENEQTNDYINKVKELIESDDKTLRPLQVLIEYYINHYDQLSKDANQILSDKSVKDVIIENYLNIFNKEPKDAVAALDEICKICIDNELEVK